MSPAAETPGAPGPPAPSGPRWAVWTSEALAPAVLAALLPVVVGAAAGGRRGAGLAVVAAAVAVGPGLAVVVALVRSGRVVDHHLPRRGDRPRVLAAGLAGVLAAVALLVLAGAPRELAVLLTAMAALLAVLTAVSTRWKVSLHAAAATASLVALLSALGPWALAGAPLVVAVCWSRLALRVHTRAQVVAGAALGLAAGAVAQLLAG